MPRQEITRTMPRFNGKDVDDLNFRELKLLATSLVLRVMELEELTASMRRDRAVRRVLHGGATPADLPLAAPFFDGIKP